MVTCPEGSGEGDALLVTTPGSKEVEIIIPPGVNAGDDFHVSFEDEDDASGEEAPEPSVVEQSQQVVEQKLEEARAAFDEQKSALEGAEATQQRAAAAAEELEESIREAQETAGAMNVVCPEGVAAGQSRPGPRGAPACTRFCLISHRCTRRGCPG